MKTLIAVLLLTAAPMFASEPSFTAASAINSLGIDLLRHSSNSGENALLSPYSIQNALVMAYAGAEGNTKAEMASVLHYSKRDAEVQNAFVGLRKALEDLAAKSAGQAERIRQYGGQADPITITTANRLFGQSGYSFKEAFLSLVKDKYDAPLEALDFIKDADTAIADINKWVEDQTRERIRNLIPKGGLNGDSRLVLVNAIYLKAPWEMEFSENATQSRTFSLGAHNLVSVPTMTTHKSLGYAKHDGYVALTIPYRGGELQFLVLLPDNVDGLAELERRLTPAMLVRCL